MVKFVVKCVVKVMVKLKNCWIGTKIGVVVHMTVTTVTTLTKRQKDKKAKKTKIQNDKKYFLKRQKDKESKRQKDKDKMGCLILVFYMSKVWYNVSSMVVTTHTDSSIGHNPEFYRQDPSPLFYPTQYVFLLRTSLKKE